jgi:hypothetical protein
MPRGLRYACFLGVLVAALSASADTFFPIYERYLAAIKAKDLAQAKSFLTAGKARETKSVADLDVISPKKDLRKHEEIVDGNDATLIVTADVEGNRSTGRIQFARESGSWKILSELWELGSGPEESAANDVIQPKSDEQRAALRKLREHGYPQPTADFLVMTAGTGELELVKLFLAAGYSPDTKANGTPAIVNAAMSGHGDVVEYLIAAGADVNAVDDVNTTALMRIASNCEATKTVRALLKAGARTGIKSAGGTTAAQLAEYANCAENLAALQTR